VSERLNVIVSGGTSTGKTELGRKLLEMVAPMSGSSPSRIPSNSCPASPIPSA
jgi:nicotinamide riboside kinase